MEKKNLSSYPLTGYLLFISFGLIIFFISAFMVLQIRTKSNARVKVPDLIGKRYIDVHNELMRLQLKVKLDQKRNPEKNDGMIIDQSIAPGKIIEAGTKIYLTVNIGTDFVTVPNLIHQPLNTALSNLENVLSGEVYVKMPLGGITYIKATNDEQPETVISQIPEPGKKTDTSDKIYLLVTEPIGAPKVSEMNLQPFDLIMKKMNQESIKWKATINTVKKRELNGLVNSFKNENGTLKFTVNYLPKDYSYEAGYEKVSFKVKEPGIYKAILTDKDEKNANTIFNDINYKVNENVEFIFYRSGTQIIQIFQNEKKVADFTYKPAI